MFKKNLFWLLSGIIVLIFFSCQKLPSAPSPSSDNPSKQLEFTITSELPTEISVTVDSSSKKIPSRGSVVFYYAINPHFIPVKANTSFRDTAGKVIGETLYWEFTSNVAGTNTEVVNLVYSKSSCFIAIKNLSKRKMGAVWVKAGASVAEAELLIPGDGKIHHVGYFNASPGMEIRAFYLDDPSMFCYWIEGVHFRLDWNENQIAVLTIRNAPPEGSPGEVGHQGGSIKGLEADSEMFFQVERAEFSGNNLTDLKDLKIKSIVNSE